MTREVGSGNAKKIISLLKPKPSLNREYVVGQKISVIKQRDPWFFGDQLLPTVVDPYTGELHGNPEYVNKYQTKDAGFSYLPQFFLRVFLETAEINVRFGLPHGSQMIDTLSQSSIYPATVSNYKNVGTSDLSIISLLSQVSTPDGDDSTRYKFSTHWIDLNRDGRTTGDGPEISTTTSTTCSPVDYCFGCFLGGGTSFAGCVEVKGYGCTGQERLADAVSYAPYECASQYIGQAANYRGGVIPFGTAPCNAKDCVTTTSTTTSTTSAPPPPPSNIFQFPTHVAFVALPPRLPYIT